MTSRGLSEPMKKFIHPLRHRPMKVSLADIETEAPPVNPTMVTTRRQSGSNSDPATDVSSALESLPQDVRSAGSKKRRRPQAADEPTPPAVQDDSAHATTRKRQKLPVREKDEEHFERHTHIAVEIPVRDITQDNAPMWAAPEQGKFKGKRVLAEDKPSNPEVQEGDNQNGDEPEEGRSLSPVPQEAADEVALLHGTSGKTLRERGRRMKAGSRLERNMKLTPEPIKVADTSKTAKPKHKRFDSEEPAAEEFDQVVKDEAEVEEEDESSDDDAPEVVATQDAQEKAIVTARSAAKAVEEQDATVRKKRKERDAQLKEQAKAVNKKRKRADDGGEGHATSTPLNVIENLGENESGEEPSRGASGSSKDNPKSSKSGAIITKNNIPEFLPAEYLEDDPIEDHNSFSPPEQTMSNKSKKIKFIDPTPKKPKDRRKGSTIYRVAEAHGDGLLAPKAASNARSVKEAWLNGQRGAGGAKRVVNGGFFKRR